MEMQTAQTASYCTSTRKIMVKVGKKVKVSVFIQCSFL